MKISQATTITRAAIASAIALNAEGRARDAQYIIPFWVSAAGIGKTTALRDLARSLGLTPVTLMGSQYDPAELAGWALPIEGGDRMKRSTPDWLPDGSVPTLLILDEAPQSTTAVQNIFAQMTNEHRVGPHVLPSNCYIVAAGNRASDRAGTTSIPTHLRDRLLFLEIDADVEDTVAYFAKVGVDERVAAYLRHRPEYLSQFDSAANSCPSPRSWERVGSILSFPIDAQCMTFAIQGQVGQAATADFLGYLRVYAQMPDIDNLISNPQDAPLPHNPAILHAVCAALSRRLKDSNAANIMDYIKRIPQQEFAAYTVKDALARDPDLKQSNALRQWILSDGRALVL
jgi:hypothetical protein